jgi:hypothetical protein
MKSDVASVRSVKAFLEQHKCIYLKIKASLGNQELKSQTVVFTTKEIIDNLTTDFYLHGTSGIFNVAENLYPTHWYGEYHPFEFEIVVNSNIAM